jgi:zinc D-Ala-D-Ala carboxypeptidase
MQSPWKYFELDELKCKCGNCGSTGMEMDYEFMERLVALREECGFPFMITSGYRCPSHNVRVSKTSFDGPHTTGKAVDIGISGERAYLLVGHAYDKKFTGIGIKQKGEIKDRFIHLDILEAPDYPRPCIYSY